MQVLTLLRYRLGWIWGRGEVIAQRTQWTQVVVDGFNTGYMPAWTARVATSGGGACSGGGGRGGLGVLGSGIGSW